MSAKELVDKAWDIATTCKTLYVMGCFGAPMNAENKQRYTQNHIYNKRAARKKLIMSASDDTFGFDCVCLIKGILWGFCKDKNQKYGGAFYSSNGVPDIGTEQMLKKCYGVSSNFLDIKKGELLWMPGHVGIYVGGGLAVECSPSWKNGVQVTACNCTQGGYHTRNWKKHGKLPYVTYKDSEDPERLTYTVVKGDTLSRIARRYGVSVKELVALNDIENPNLIHVGQIIKIR